MPAQGKSGITQIENFSCDDFATRFAGEIKGFQCNGYVSKKNERRMDNCIKYTIVAGKKVCHIVSAALPWPLRHFFDLNDFNTSLLIFLYSLPAWDALSFKSIAWSPRGIYQCCPGKALTYHACHA